MDCLNLAQGAGVTEADLMAAIHAAADAADKLVAAQKALAAEAGNGKAALPIFALPDSAALTRISTLSQQQIHQILADEGDSGCLERGHRLEAAKKGALDALRSAGAVRSEASGALASPSSLTPHRKHHLIVLEDLYGACSSFYALHHAMANVHLESLCQIQWRDFPAVQCLCPTRRPWSLHCCAWPTR